MGVDDEKIGPNNASIYLKSGENLSHYQMSSQLYHAQPTSSRKERSRPCRKRKRSEPSPIPMNPEKPKVGFGCHDLLVELSMHFCRLFAVSVLYGLEIGIFCPKLIDF